MLFRSYVVMAVAGVDARLWEQRIAQAADHGERLLGFAMRRLPAAKARITFDDLGDGVVFLGLMGFIDPPREEAKAAIAECRRSEEHTSELQSLMRISYAVFCLKKQKYILSH